MTWCIRRAGMSSTMFSAIEDILDASTASEGESRFEDNDDVPDSDGDSAADSSDSDEEWLDVVDDESAAPRRSHARKTLGYILAVSCRN
eukprot:m.613915 g.613915  ORF g.613915 m.613915 type:complete len:89 (-) comp22504_c0_seq13:793-1059(-)